MPPPTKEEGGGSCFHTGESDLPEGNLGFHGRVLGPDGRLDGAEGGEGDGHLQHARPRDPAGAEGPSPGDGDPGGGGASTVRLVSNPRKDCAHGVGVAV